MGLRHSGVAGEPGRSVPPRYLVGLASFVQTALVSSLLELLAAEPARAQRLALAWNKMLMVQLELFLKALVPCFPAWDEA